MQIRIRIILSIIAPLLVTSCATTRYVPENEYLLKKYKITVTQSKSIQPATLTPYIKQRPNTTIFLGWKALLNIYSFSPKSESRWAIFKRDRRSACDF